MAYCGGVQYMAQLHGMLRGNAPGDFSRGCLENIRFLRIWAQSPSSEFSPRSEGVRCVKTHTHLTTHDMRVCERRIMINGYFYCKVNIISTFFAEVSKIWSNFCERKIKKSLTFFVTSFAFNTPPSDHLRLMINLCLMASFQNVENVRPPWPSGQWRGEGCNGPPCKYYNHDLGFLRSTIIK